MKTAEIVCRSNNDGQYLFMGVSFEEELLKEFQSYSEMKYIKWVIDLDAQLKTEKGKRHPQDTLNIIFIEKVSLDFDFAEKLNLFDIVEGPCFTADGELGDAILQLCISAEMRFIVARKYYTTKETIRIEFEVCHSDSDWDCQKALITQTI